MAELERALTVGLATRDNIWTASLSKASPANWQIRRALGLREVGMPGAKQPKFALCDANMLHKELRGLATEQLPVHDLDAIATAWKKGTFKKEISKLLAQYGKIWSPSMVERRLQTCDTTHLLMAGNDEFYKVDLFSGMSTHREFIALQLEHLVFSKAVTYYRNHYKFRASLKCRVAVATDPAEPIVREPSAEEPPSLTVKLRLPTRTDELFKIWEKYEATFAGLGKRKQSLPAAHQRLAPDRMYQAGHRTKNTGDHAPKTKVARTTRRLSALSHGIQEMAQDVSIEVNSPANEDASDCEMTEKARAMSQSPPNQPDDFEPTGADVVRLDTETPASPAVPDEAPAKPEPQIVTLRLRDQLRLLLMDEFCTYPFTNADASDAAALWATSRDLDTQLLTVWSNDRANIEQELGEEQYKAVNKTVEFWTTIRTSGRALGEKTDWHPLQDGKPVPHFAFEQWATKLGGVPQNQKVIYHFTKSRVELGDDAEATARRLGVAFAVTTQFPAAARLFGEGIAKFNANMAMLVDSFLRQKM